MNGNPLSNLGEIDLTLDFEGYKVDHTFLVSKDITRNCLLGRDFCIKNGVRLYYDLGCFRFRDVSDYIALVRDVHVSMVRCNKTFVIPPQQVMRVYAKAPQEDFGSPAVQVTTLADGFIMDEPGLSLIPTVMKRKYHRTFPILIMNNTNRHYKVKRNTLLGQVTTVDAVHTVPNYLKGDSADFQEENNFQEETFQKDIFRSRIPSKPSRRSKKSKKLQVNHVDVSNPFGYPDCSSSPGEQSPMDSSSLSGQSPSQNSSSSPEQSEKPSEEDPAFIENIKCPDEQKNELFDLLQSYKDRFAKSYLDLGRAKSVAMKLDTGDHPPIAQRGYRTPYLQRDLVDDTIDKMLAANICKTSRSPWASPIVIVSKKNSDEPRFCIDYRKLNAILKSKGSWPIPHFDDILANLGNAKVYSALDLRGAYWQVPYASEADAEKSAFVCHRGHFQMNVMAFGIASAPSLFQELMSRALEGGINKFLLVYLDDVLVYSNSISEHFQHLRWTLQKLREEGLKLKLSKCYFFQKEVSYLGYLCTPAGLKPDPKKVDAIKNMNCPSDIHQVRSFVSMCSFYRRLIPRFSEVALPMIKLTRKGVPFERTKEFYDSFEKLRTALINPPVLAFPKPHLPYRLYTDSSDEACGALLSQIHDDGEEHPIHYISHKFSRSQARGWNTTMKETWALWWSLKKFDCYLRDAEIQCFTDHKPLEYCLKAEQTNKMIQRWAMDIQSFNIKISYLKGSSNVFADGLSRLPGAPDDPDPYFPEFKNNKEAIEMIGMIATNKIENPVDANQQDSDSDSSTDVDADKSPSDEAAMYNSFYDMAKEQRLDTYLNTIRTSLEQGNPSEHVFSRFIIVNDILYYCEDPEGTNPRLRLALPKRAGESVLLQYHDNNGHLGIQRCFDTIRRKYYWHGMFTDIVHYINHCTTCSERNLKGITPPMGVMDLPMGPMRKLGIDTCGPYNLTPLGNRYIVTFVDLYSGWPEAYAVARKDAQTIVNLLHKEHIPRYSCPLAIVTDSGTEYANTVLEEYCDAYNIKHIKTTFYNPRGNSKTERYHRCMHDTIAKLISNPKYRNSWDNCLEDALAAYRFGVARSHKFSPYYLLLGQDPIFPIDNVLQPRRPYYGDDEHKILMQEQHKSFNIMKKNVQKQSKLNKEKIDKKAQVLEFKPNDPVFFRNHRATKLEPKWFSHFRVLTRTSDTSYIIKNMKTGKIQKRVHVRHLHPSLKDWTDPPEKLEPIEHLKVNSQQHRLRLGKARLAYHDQSSNDEQNSDHSPDSSMDEEDLSPPRDQDRLLQRKRKLEHNVRPPVPVTHNTDRSGESEEDMPSDVDDTEVGGSNKGKVKVEDKVNDNTKVKDDKKTSGNRSKGRKGQGQPAVSTHPMTLRTKLVSSVNTDRLRNRQLRRKVANIAHELNTKVDNMGQKFDATANDIAQKLDKVDVIVQKLDTLGASVNTLDSTSSDVEPHIIGSSVKTGNTARLCDSCAEFAELKQEYASIKQSFASMEKELASSKEDLCSTRSELSKTKGALDQILSYARQVDRH